MHEINLESDLLASNEEIARENKNIFDQHGIYVFNLMSAPGSGKTSLLEKTIPELKGRLRLAVIEGDIQSTKDADRIKALGVEAFQINTGSLCHLDARMVHNSLHHFHLHGLDLLIIENVGNLVCPAEFDLGEDHRVMVYSVSEGNDKPKKYPLMFHRSHLILINKTDLMSHTDFDIQKARKDASDVNPKADIIEISCKTGEGLDRWIEWLTTRIMMKKS
ncbi:MAG: hydrogenase nickel incorporation protein HypB [Acidobacteriota bacterium]